MEKSPFGQESKVVVPVEVGLTEPPPPQPPPHDDGAAFVVTVNTLVTVPTTTLTDMGEL